MLTRFARYCTRALQWCKILQIDLFLSSGKDGKLRHSLYDKRDDFNSFHSWVATSFLRPPIAFLSHNILVSDTPRFGPHIDVLFGGWCDFPISVSDRDMWMNVWNHLFKSFWSVWGSDKTKWCSLSRMLHNILADDHKQRHPPLIRYYTYLWPWYCTWHYYRILLFSEMREVSIEHKI